MSLSDKYWAEHGLTGLTVEHFLDKVVQDDSEGYSKADIRRFLLEMEAGIILNIETKAREAPMFAAMRDEVVADTEQRFRALREKYAD